MSISPTLTVKGAPNATVGWWSLMIGLFFLAFVLYAASAGSLPKYKAWIF